MDSKKHTFVYVSPPELHFYLNSRKTHSQRVKIANPYDRRVKFKVQSTDKNNTYSVIEPVGSIGAIHMYNLTVRLNTPIPPQSNLVDRFKIILCDNDTSEVLGQRVIVSKIHEGDGDSESTNDSDRFEQIEESSRSSDHHKSEQRYSSLQDPNMQRPQQLNKIALVIMALCSLILFLPTHHDPSIESSYAYLIPSELHLGVGVKVFAAFMLGLCLMAVLNQRN